MSALAISDLREIDGAYRALVNAFGQDRTPSRSSIGRYWQRLDVAYGMPAPRRQGSVIVEVVRPS